MAHDTLLKTITIIIPAYNEEKRIKHTLKNYAHFFEKKMQHAEIKTTLLVVLNGCTDNTLGVVTKLQQQWPSLIKILELQQAGKGHAIIQGFSQVLKFPADFIGFVDADMATSPRDFYELIESCLENNNLDGIIASRYMPGAYVSPARPWYKRVGSILFYDPLVRLLFGLRYYDLQCGAKLFKRHVISTIIANLTVKQWAFDVELLYLCKKNKFTIKEQPTTWNDQTGSKLHIFSGGIKMISSIFKLRLQHSPFKKFLD